MDSHHTTDSSKHSADTTLHERIAELEAQLREARDQINHVEEEYQQFAYIVSHDLSAPLRQAEGFARIINQKYRGTFDEKSQKHMEMILTSTAKGQRQLDALLRYSRLNTRMNPFAKTELQHAFDGAINRLSHVIETTHAEINCGTLPSINADVEQMQILFMHVLDNALKFSRKHITPVVNITTTTDDSYHIISFSDNGIGINKKHHEKAFKIFRRVVEDDAHFDGMGMGLALVRKIAHHHKGTIRIHGNEMGGTTIELTVPVLKS